MKILRTKRLTSAALALVMILTLFAGCKGASAQNGDDPEFVYVPNYVNLPKEITDMNNSCVVGDTIYFTKYTPVYPDGTEVPQEDLDAYYEQVNAYYASQSSATDIAVKYARSYAVASPMPTAMPVEGVIVETEEITAEEEDEEVVAETPPPVDGDMDILPPSDYPEADFTYEYRLYSVKIDGTGLRYLDGFSPLKAENKENSYSSINKFMPDGAGNLWLMEQLNEQFFDLPADFDEMTDNKYEYYRSEKNTYYVHKLGENGEKAVSLCLNDYIENVESIDYFYMYNFAVDAKGNIFFGDNNNSLYVVGADGQLVTKLAIEGWINGYVRLGDGSIGVAMNGDKGGTEIKTIDLTANDWGEAYALKTYFYDFLSGGDAYDFCYNNGTTLYGYDLETETETKIITWINNDIDGNRLQFCDVKQNGDIFIISYNYNNDSGANFEIANLVKTPASQVKQKTSISLATLYLNYELREVILKFNKTNPDYRIEVRDYSEYNTYGEGDNYNPNAGLMKLNTEIISGRIPDLISTGDIPYKQYAAKGLLEDLYKYIDADPELNRDALMVPVLRAMEAEGKLYTIAASFSVMSVAGNPDVLGTNPNWTMQDFMNIVAAHPEADWPLGMGMTRDQVFYSLCALNIESYVDWMTGQCYFDTPDFKALLEFAKSFPRSEDIDYENMDWVSESELIREGRMIASFFSLSDFYNFQYYDAMYGGNIVFKGLPGEDSGAVARIDGGLAMTTSCKNKDAAWQFMRTVLGEDYQKNMWGFPTNKAAFDAKVKEAMKQDYDANGNPISHGGMSDGENSIEFYALTQEQVDKVMALINSATHTGSYDMSLIEIINEEAEAYFAGEKGVDETAALIQSRMRLYINEQR